MDDPTVLGRLTLMLLRASVQQPGALPVDYGVVLMPSADVLSQEEASALLAATDAYHEAIAEVKAGALIITTRELDEQERIEANHAAGIFVETLSQMTAGGGAGALVRVVGFRDSMFVPVATVKRWLRRTGCFYCSMAIGVPTPEDSPLVTAVLYLGQRKS